MAKDHKPRVGRPRDPLSDDDPAVARVLLGASDALPPDQREVIRLVCRAVSPTVASVERALAILRPRDADGGWGWFGRELRRTSTQRPE